MASQNPYDFDFETNAEISKNLLDVSQVEPEPDRTEEDFIQQNEILDQELKKYDQLLDAWPIRIYKILTSLYIALLNIGVISMVLFLVPLFKGGSTTEIIIGVCIVIFIAFLCFSIYGCLLLRRALHTKDVLKAEKCIFLFRIFLTVSVILFAGVLFGSYQYNSWNLTASLFYGSVVIISVINLGTAIYVKNVLLQRGVFQQFSSYPINAT